MVLLKAFCLDKKYVKMKIDKRGSYEENMKKDGVVYKLIDRISYRGCRKRNLKETVEIIDKYMKMSDEEFIMDYTEICSKYEHKKLVFFAILIGVVISIIMNVWKSFFKFLIEIFTSKSAVVIEVKNQAVILSIIIILLISIIVIVILYDMVKTLYVLNKKQIILNQVKDMRKSI